jgi:hypothetical protein
LGGGGKDYGISRKRDEGGNRWEKRRKKKEGLTPFFSISKC